MLSLQMKSGEYLTIGDNIVVQIFRGSGPAFQVSIKAPREIPVVRGELLERGGGERPGGLLNRRSKSRSDQIHAAKQLQKLAVRRERAQAAHERQAAAVEEMQNILSRMEHSAAQEEIEALRAQLERFVDAEEGGAGTGAWENA